MRRLAAFEDLGPVHAIFMDGRVNPFLGYERQPAEDFRPIFERFLGSGSFYVFEQDGRVAGFYSATRFHGRGAHVAELGSLAVDPALQGTGVATRMVEDALAMLAGDGVSRVELRAAADNPRGIAFYRKMGFAAEGALLRGFKRRDDPEFVDDVLMARLLRDEGRPMKAVTLSALGGPENFAVTEMASADLPPGSIRVRNKAIGVNFIDIYQRKGLYPVSLPAVLGQEGAGVVVAAGDGAAFKPGDRVAYLGFSTYADETIVDAARAALIPMGVSDDLAAAAFLKGLTAAMLVKDVYPLKAGETALVTAAAGGVGSLLTQWATHLGARVIAIVGDSAKIAAAKANGTDAVINRKETPDTAGKVRALTSGKGVEVVYDSVGAATFEASLDSLGLRGMMVSYGNASGPVPAIQPLDLTRRGSLTLARPSLFHYATPDRLAEMAKAVFDLIGQGVLRPTIAKTFPLAAAGDAHRLLEAGETIGAIVLKP